MHTVENRGIRRPSELITLSALLLVCLALVGCVAVVTILASKHHTRQRARTFAQAVADVHRAGVPVTAQALQAPLPPPEQNAAPLYTKLTALLKAQPLSQKDKIIDSLATHTMPSAAQLERARIVLKNHAELLRLIHQAAARPHCVFVRDWSNPPAVLFPEFATMREAVRLLTAESLLLAHDGKPLEAVRNQALGFQIARHAADENYLIAYLSGVACDAVTLSGMNKILYMAGTNPAVADAVRAAVEKDWTPHNLVHAFQSEAGSHVVLIEYLRKQNPAVLNELTSDTSSPPLHMDAKAWNAFLDANGVALLGRMHRIIAVVDLPYRESEPIMHAVENEVDQSKDPQTDLLSTILFPVFTGVTAKRAQIQAQAEATSTGAAVLAWKARHGACPTMLAQVMTPVPTDPFDGKPLRYRREGTGFIIYSVGPEGTFSGGSPKEKPGTSEVVFRYPLSPYYAGPVKEGS